jgi:hypothetical protein
MRTIWLVLCAAVAVVIAAPAVAGTTAPTAPVVPAFDNLLPDDAVLYVSLRNLPDALQKVKLTAGYKIFDELKLLERLTPPDKYAELQQLYGTFIEPLGDICRGEMALVALSFDVEPVGQPELAVLIDVSQGQNALNDYLVTTIFPLLDEKGIKPETQDVAGVKVTKIVPAPERESAVFYAVKDGVLIVSPRLDTLSDLLANVGPGPARAMLPSNTLYANVRKAVGASDLTVYVNVSTPIEKALEEGGEPSTVLRVLGFDKLRAVGLGTKIGADGSGTTVMRLATAGKPGGLLGVAARPGGAFKSLKRAPRSTGLYAAANVGSLQDLYAQLMQIVQELGEHGGDMAEFDQGMAQIEAALGMSLSEDVLPAFGGEIALTVRVPEAIGVPPAAILIEVKDKDKVQQFVDRVLELVQSFGGDGGIRVLTRQYNGVDIDTVIASPMLSPAVAVLDDFLVVGTSAETVKGIIDAGQGGETIEQRPDFAATMGGLPKTGTGIFYLDLKEVYEFVFPIVASRIPPDGRGAELVAELGKLGEHLGGVGQVTSGDESGITYTLYSKKALLEPLVLGAAAVIMPATARAHEVATETASMSNVKQLCLAVAIYENENGELPEKLSDIAPYAGNASVFVHPKNRAKAALIDLEKPETIEANSDYELMIKGGSSNDIADPSRAVIIREKQVFSGDSRVLGFVDGHVKKVHEGPPSVPSDDATGE